MKTNERHDEAVVELVCPTCRAGSASLLSCAHILSPLKRSKSEAAFTVRPCELPALPGSPQITRELQDKSDPNPVTMSLVARRWLGTKDHRGPALVAPIHYTPEHRGWLADHGMKSDDTNRKGKGRKTDVAGRLEDVPTGFVSYKGRTPRQRMMARLERHSEAGYTFLKRWADTTVRRPFWRPQQVNIEARGFPRFTTASLSADGHARRALDITFDLVAARARRLHDKENTVRAKDPMGASSGYPGLDRPDGGWARATGIKRGDRLERVKQSHVEDPLIAHLDLWAASGAVRIPGRGYLPPRVLIGALAFRDWIAGWKMSDVEAYDPKLADSTRWHVHDLQQQLRENYAPRNWDPIYGMSNRWRSRFRCVTF